MPEYIMTRTNAQAEAMQFEATQKNFNEITEWVQQYNPNYVLSWNGWDRSYLDTTTYERVEAESGWLTIYAEGTRHNQICMPGDWLIKSNKNTFYTMREKDFDEIFVVLH